MFFPLFKLICISVVVVVVGFILYCRVLSFKHVRAKVCMTWRVNLRAQQGCAETIARTPQASVWRRSVLFHLCLMEFHR